MVGRFNKLSHREACGRSERRPLLGQESGKTATLPGADLATRRIPKRSCRADAARGSTQHLDRLRKIPHTHRLERPLLL